MPGAANSSSASASGGGSVLARAWNYVFGLVEEDEGYGSEGEDGLVGPIGGREEGEDTDPNEWVPAQWGPYARAAGPPLGNASAEVEAEKRAAIEMAVAVLRASLPAGEELRCLRMGV